MNWLRAVALCMVCMCVCAAMLHKFVCSHPTDQAVALLVVLDWVDQALSRVTEAASHLSSLSLSKVRSILSNPSFVVDSRHFPTQPLALGLSAVAPVMLELVLWMHAVRDVAQAKPSTAVTSAKIAFLSNAIAKRLGL